jgi:hypothetical protein
MRAGCAASPRTGGLNISYLGSSYSMGYLFIAVVVNNLEQAKKEHRAPLDVEARRRYPT